MTRQWTILLLVLGVSAWGCGGTPADDNDDDTDTGADGDADTDTDGDTDGDSDGDSSCGEPDTAIQFAQELDVGPGQTYADPSAVPWETLSPGTLVRIHYRDTPYADKWVINTVASADAPLVVRGIPTDGGQRPVITGEDATTRQALDYWNEPRSVIKIGGSSQPQEDIIPAYVSIENLEIRSARPPFRFTNDSGATETYAKNAASIHIEVGDHITVRNCVLHDSGNGLFSGHQSSRVRLVGNHIYNNGIEDSIYEHNSYTESFGITFEYNHYGPLRAGCLGNNLKDRSTDTVIRYNWVESGNRQLDLVESDDAAFVADPDYLSTHVYGNILIEPEDAGNSQLIHYGGDGGDQSMYRNGVLYLYHNTIVSTRSGNTTLVRISTNQGSADIRNNIIYGTAAGERMAICNGTGQLSLQGNWLEQGWTDTHESSMDPGAHLEVFDNVIGVHPGFVDLTNQDLTLALGSSCIDQGTVLPAAWPKVSCQYERHQTGTERPEDGALDIGALD